MDCIRDITGRYGSPAPVLTFANHRRFPTSSRLAGNARDEGIRQST